MQKAKVVDNALPNGDFQDSSTQAALDGTIVRSAFQNDNFNNLFEFVTGAGYDLIDDDLSQITKAAKGLYNPNFIYNTSGIASQSVSDVVRGSDGKYYEVQNDAVNGDNPVGSVTGNWVLTTLDKNVLGLNNAVPFTPTADNHPATKKYVDDVTLLEIASAAEAQAQTNNTKAISPLRLADAFLGANQSAANSGYQILPGGLIVQWIRFSSTTTADEVFNFPLTFPGKVFAVTTGGQIGGVPSTDDNAANFSASVTSNSQFTVNRADNITGTHTYTCIALGN